MLAPGSDSRRAHTPCSNTRRGACGGRIAPVWKHRRWWGGKSGAKGRLEMAKVSTRWRAMQAQLGKKKPRPNLVQSLSRGYGATAARLTPDQKGGSSNFSGLIFLPAKTTLKALSMAQPLLPPSTLDNSGGKTCSPTPSQLKQYSATGTRIRVARMRAEYPDQLDYSGHAHQTSQQTKAGNNSLRPRTSFPPFLHNNCKWSHPCLNRRPYGY